MKLINGYNKIINLASIILILFCQFSFTKKTIANIILNEDLYYLNAEDRKTFLLKCKKNNQIKNSTVCMNFLGIKIFLKGYLDNDIEDAKFNIYKKKAVKYLNLAADQGSKIAVKNLAWIYSTNKTNFKSLEKSSQLFERLKKDNIKYKETVEKKETVKHKKKYNLANLELALLLIDNLVIYFKAGENKPYNYITNKQINYAYMLLEKIIIKSKASPSELETLKEKIREKNKILLSFLKNDLKSFSNDERIKAQKDLKKLEDLSIN